MTKGTKRLLTAGALLLALAVGFLVEERVRGVRALRTWQASMRANGEKFTIAEITLPAPTNAACRILAPQEAASRLAAAVSSSDSPPAMRYVAPGRAQAGWQAKGWRLERKRSTNWLDAAAGLQPALPAIENLRADLTNQAFVVRLNYDQGFEMLLPHLARYKGAAIALRTAMQLALRQQRLDLATENLVAMAALIDLSKGEGLLISELVRDAIAAIGVGAVWEALQADGWTDAQLAAIQEAWQRPEFMNGMARAFVVERAVGSLVYVRGRYSLPKLFQVMQDAGFSTLAAPADTSFMDRLGWIGDALQPVVGSGSRFKQLVGLGVWRVAWVEQDQLRYQQLIHGELERMRAAAKAEHFRPTPPAADVGSQPAGDTPAGWDRMRYWISNSLVRALDRCADKAAMAEAQRELALTALAIERYQLRHARLPTQLEALVPEFLAALPRDWFAGAPLRYQLNPDGSFLLYSVGRDGHDDGGDARMKANDPPTDATPSFVNGRDLVWPQPASPTEIVAFEAGLSAK